MKTHFFRFAVVLLALSVLPVLPSAESTAPAKNIPQWRGQYGGFPDFSTTVLRTAAAWGSFWQRMNKEVPQALDDAKEVAVVVYIGERPTGGYIVRILDYAVSGDEYVVTWQEVPPAPDSFTTQALTTPWVAAVLPRTDRKIVFKQAAR